MWYWTLLTLEAAPWIQLLMHSSFLSKCGHLRGGRPAPSAASGGGRSRPLRSGEIEPVGSDGRGRRGDRGLRGGRPSRGASWPAPLPLGAAAGSKRESAAPAEFMSISLPLRDFAYFQTFSQHLADITISSQRTSKSRSVQRARTQAACKMRIAVAPRTLICARARLRSGGPPARAPMDGGGGRVTAPPRRA